MNLHISELVSKILEPIVDTFEGGCEKISTEDVLASIDSLNEQFKTGVRNPGGNLLRMKNLMFVQNAILKVNLSLLQEIRNSVCVPEIVNQKSQKIQNQNQNLKS